MNPERRGPPSPKELMEHALASQIFIDTVGSAYAGKFGDPKEFLTYVAHNIRDDDAYFQQYVDEHRSTLYDQSIDPDPMTIKNLVAARIDAHMSIEDDMKRHAEGIGIRARYFAQIANEYEGG